MGIKQNLRIRTLIREFINGLMEENIKVNGKIIICMVKEFMFGKMEENTMVNI